MENAPILLCNLVSMGMPMKEAKKRVEAAQKKAEPVMDEAAVKNQLRAELKQYGINPAPNAKVETLQAKLKEVQKAEEPAVDEAAEEEDEDLI